MGCVYILAEPVIANTWEGYMQIVQGGDVNYGQKTPVKVEFDPVSGIYSFRRDCGAGIFQLADMKYTGISTLGGTQYVEIYGQSRGPGTGDQYSVLRVLH